MDCKNEIYSLGEHSNILVYSYGERWWLDMLWWLFYDVQKYLGTVLHTWNQHGDVDWLYINRKNYYGWANQPNLKCLKKVIIPATYGLCWMKRGNSIFDVLYNELKLK